MPSTLPAPIDKLAIVVVTYKRQELLANLFDSMTELTAAPWRIVIVDNENSRETEAMCTAFNERLTNLWGIDTEQPDAQGGTDRVIYAPQLENGGGAGGFSAGTKCAYDLGAQWFWVMDDDVLVIPEGIERLAKWTDRYDVIQGSRLDFDGGAFFWQYQLILSLGIPNPVAKWDLGPEGYRAMNQLCFEGGMFSRRVVDKIGLPDARFFIYGDDACYGYVASQHFPAAVVADVVLKRARAPIVLTPHDGEFARLAGADAAGRAEAASAFAAAHGCTVVRKGPETVCAFPDGDTAVLRAGNPGMAKGGSGDVLAGMLGALLCQMPARDAVETAVWLHGRAGDVCAARMGEYAMNPTDVIAALPEVTKTIIR